MTPRTASQRPHAQMQETRSGEEKIRLRAAGVALAAGIVGVGIWLFVEGRSPDAASRKGAAVEAATPGAAPDEGALEAAAPQVPIAAVRLEGEFFTRITETNDVRRGRGDVVAAATIVDGVFLDRSQQWDEGAVWWEGGAIRPTSLWISGTPPETDRRWIELRLNGIYRIGSALVQADDNDSYVLSYRDLGAGRWVRLWKVPPLVSFGMQIRPDPADETQRHTFAAPIETDVLRFEANRGDGMYSVSEIQVFGVPVG